jgi:hypothetical protein
MVRIALGLRRFVRAGWRRRSVVGRGPVPGGLFRGGEGIHGVRSHPYGKGLTSTARDSPRGPARTADPVRRTKSLTRTGPPSAVPETLTGTGPPSGRIPHARHPALRAEPSTRGTPPSGPSPRCWASEPRAKPWTGGTQRPDGALDRRSRRRDENLDPGNPSARTKPRAWGIPASERSSGLGDPGARTKARPRETHHPDKTLGPGNPTPERNPGLGNRRARGKLSARGSRP